jgi:hypothetical protein
MPLGSFELMTTQDGYRAAFKAVQDNVRKCVVRQGFSYFMQEPADGLAVDYAGENDAIERSGYGIASLFDGEPEVSDSPSASQQYLQTLSSDDRTKLDEIAGLCYREAHAVVFASSPLENPETLDELGSVELVIETDKRVVDATKLWAACVASTGYKAENRTALRNLLEAKARRILGATVEVLSDGSLRVGFQDAPVDETKLNAAEEEFASEELLVAKRDVECNELHLREVQLLVRDEKFAEIFAK